ncbi:NUDIX hydrolase [Tistrella mobilis]|uniref:NUDIX hydrolase n=1 Tax=Tistrella mobilis TaxID=171437 RepID=UPI00059F4E69|nr:NUDIX domain-containing protein [Tistrella mobilis]
MTFRHQIIPAVYLVLMEGKRLLMLRRAGTGYMDGYYSLVAGHLDGGEPLSRAIAREAEEEIGIFIAQEALQLIHVVHTPPEPGDAPGQERIDFYFKASIFSGEISNCELHKCDDIRWFDIDQLPKNMVPRVAVALDGIFAGTILSEPHWVELARST